MGIRDQNLEGIGAVFATFSIRQTAGVDDLKDADVGKAVTVTASNQAAPTSDGSMLLGKLVDLTLTDADNGKRVATVQIGGIVTLSVVATVPVVGNRVVGGANPSTVELFFSTAPTLLPEFILREIKRGQKMRPGLADLGATSTVVNANRYTPFFISGSPTQPRFSLRPIGDGAEVPRLVVAEQLHTITIPDYGMALEVSYKALRHRTAAQFKVLLWYIGFRLQADKMGLVMNTILNGDGNANPATVFNTATTGVLTYSDLITFWAEFFPYEQNVILCHKDKLKSILTMAEFKDPMAGFKFQRTGEVVSPLGSKLVRSDDVPNDLVIGLDSRFAIEEVIAQPVMVEFDKVIEQKLEEAVISESVAYAKVIREASLVLDTVW